MKLVSPYWQEEQMFYYNADTGSRQAMLDGRVPENARPVCELFKDVDAFIENLCPGLADSEGFGAEAPAQFRPGSQ